MSEAERVGPPDAAGHPIQADAIFEAARATHGHAIAMAAWDEYDWLKRVVDEDIYRAQARRELGEAMGD